MIRMAIIEQEYGTDVSTNMPKSREYVGDRMFIYFIMESLLYLPICLGLVVYMFIRGDLTLDIESLSLLGGIFLLIYILLTYLGLMIVNYSAKKRYEKIVKARKVYRKNLRAVKEINDNEPV